MVVLLFSLSFAQDDLNTAVSESTFYLESFDPVKGWCEAPKGYGLDLMIPAIITGMLILL